MARIDYLKRLLEQYQHDDRLDRKEQRIRVLQETIKKLEGNVNGLATNT
jgi:hypothetical protein